MNNNTNIMFQSRKKQLILKEKQAFEGAQCFYYYILPSCMALLLCCDLYLWEIFQKKNSKQDIFKINQALTISLLLLSIISYLCASSFYKKCNVIDISPITALQNSQIGNLSDEGKQLIAYNSQGNKPLKRYCKICEFYCDYRTKHCYKCQVCVERYDHHCFWIGSCVGRHNHRQFYFFLILQTLNNVFTFIALINTYNNAEQLLSQIVLWVKFCWFSLLTLEIGFICFTGYLLIYHTMLITYGLTTWEHMRRHKISYLRHLPTGFNPFSQGCWQNWKKFLSEPTRGNGNQTVQSWQQWIPSYEEAKKIEPECNLFQNKYYSCC